MIQTILDWFRDHFIVATFSLAVIISVAIIVFNNIDEWLNK